MGVELRPNLREMKLIKMKQVKISCNKTTVVFQLFLLELDTSRCILKKLVQQAPIGRMLQLCKHRLDECTAKNINITSSSGFFERFRAFKGFFEINLSLSRTAARFIHLYINLVYDHTYLKLFAQQKKDFSLVRNVNQISLRITFPLSKQGPTITIRKVFFKIVFFRKHYISSEKGKKKQK